MLQVFADAGGFDLTLMELACVCLISMTAPTAAMWASRDSAACEACELDLLVFR